MQLLSRYVLHVVSGVALALCAALPAQAAQTNVAVAANFPMPPTRSRRRSRQRPVTKAILSFGSTGQFTPRSPRMRPSSVPRRRRRAAGKAIEEGFAVPGSQFTYAIGKLVLWSKDPDLVQGEATLKNGDFTKISIANPRDAPYGAAAVQAMKELGVYDQLAPKIVQGNNITQAFQFVQTGNAELGFVALAQVIDDKEGSRWEVADDLYDPIKQDAVLLKKGADNEAAKAFLEFLQGPEAEAIIARFGYGLAASS